MATCVGSTIVPLATFIIGNITLTILDLTGKPAFMLKYKIQEEKHVPVSELLSSSELVNTIQH